MKKSIALFLLHIMLVVGMHPVLSMHFCEKELCSLHLLNNPAEKSCCTSDPDSEKEMHCCCTKGVKDLPDKQDIHTSHQYCCNIQTIRIATDDFRYQGNQPSFNKPLPSHDSVFVVFNDVFRQAETDHSIPAKNTFPSGGLYLQHIDIRTYIGIYRI